MIHYVVAFGQFIYYGLAAFAVAYEVMVIVRTGMFIQFFDNLDKTSPPNYTFMQKVYLFLTFGYGIWLIIGCIFMPHRLVYASILLAAMILDKVKRTDRVWLNVDAMFSLIKLFYLISLTI
jgi:hypothetical protein